MLGRSFPHFQAGKGDLPCITNKARPGVYVGGGARQRLPTLFPELAAVVRQRGNGFSWVD